MPPQPRLHPLFCMTVIGHRVCGLPEWIRLRFCFGTMKKLMSIHWTHCMAWCAGFLGLLAFNSSRHVANLERTCVVLQPLFFWSPCWMESHCQALRKPCSNKPMVSDWIFNCPTLMSRWLPDHGVGVQVLLMLSVSRPHCCNNMVSLQPRQLPEQSYWSRALVLTQSNKLSKVGHRGRLSKV